MVQNSVKNVKKTLKLNIQEETIFFSLLII